MLRGRWGASNDSFVAFSVPWAVSQLLAKAPAGALFIKPAQKDEALPSQAATLLRKNGVWQFAQLTLVYWCFFMCASWTNKK